MKDRKHGKKDSYGKRQQKIPDLFHGVCWSVIMPKSGNYYKQIVTPALPHCYIGHFR